MGAEPHIEQDRTARATDRRPVHIPVKVRRPGETWHSSCIADLSLSGFRLQSFMKLARGTDLWIMLPGFEGRRAHVTWSRAHESGCTFERPLHPAILDHIVKLSQHV
ncbi:PilZ domain-containing protein [Sphingobium amiense]|uniref:PilZ domain-containing protein n=1 Tax=Sphingobium amiense TaxID=135719 RepID=A0A494W4C1_9SPHN|nr:PilZ domain-containing protein [Sphingobium amiense]BBD99061.1 PilZ domain-containing protein [Sphingobium amiense]